MDREGRCIRRPLGVAPFRLPHPLPFVLRVGQCLAVVGQVEELSLPVHLGAPAQGEAREALVVSEIVEHGLDGRNAPGGFRRQVRCRPDLVARMRRWSSSCRCLRNDGIAMRDGFVSSVTGAGPFASCARTARRAGSARA